MLKNHMSTCKKTLVNMQHLFLMKRVSLETLIKNPTYFDDLVFSLLLHVLGPKYE